GGRQVDLRAGHRMSPPIAAVAARIASRLPGGPAHRPRQPGPDGGPGDEGSVAVTVERSAAAEAAVVADFLRRRHVLDGVDYGEMAVVSRSLPRVADALLPALDAAGVPVVDAGAELPPAHDPVAAALLLLLHTALGGGRGADTGLTAVELAPVTRVRHARDAVLTALRDGGTTEEVLWAAWSASRLERRLVRQAVAADPWARSADRSLDAVVSLFGHAADYVDR